MFVASKLIAFALEPLAWVLAFLLVAVLLLWRRPRIGRGLATTALLLLVLSGSTVLPVSILRELELRYPQLPAGTDLQRFDGIVLLGGALARSELWTAHNQVALNDHAERMTQAVGLMRRNPHLLLLFTGGISSLTPEGLTEAQRAQRFFDEMGVDKARLRYESGARNTSENAVLSATVPGIDKTRRWLLLTSGFHMPRAMGVFVKNGWNVTPYPVDYRTDSDPDWWDYSLHYGPGLWNMALHEVVGYYAYRLAGKL